LTVIWASPLGGYPRGRHVRYVMRDLDSASIEKHRAFIEIDRAQTLVIGAQLASGMKYVVDGMLDWHDIFRPFVESWRNVYLDGIIRYFDNNFFYRIPVFRGEPEPQRLVTPARVLAYRVLAEPAGLKVVIPGPLTMVKLGRNESELEDEELVMRVASALAMDVAGSARNGAALIQVDEPYLSDPDASKEDARLAVEALEVIRKSIGDARLSLAVYFDAPSPSVYEELLEAKADYLSLDLADAPGRALGLLEGKGCGGHSLVVGVINARHIYDDDYHTVKSMVEIVLKACPEITELGLTTTTWLDLIPLRFALRKTALLGAYAERLAAELGLEAEIPLTAVPKPYRV